MTKEDEIAIKAEFSHALKGGRMYDVLCIMRGIIAMGARAVLNEGEAQSAEQIAKRFKLDPVNNIFIVRDALRDLELEAIIVRDGSKWRTL